MYTYVYMYIYLSIYLSIYVSKYLYISICIYVYIYRGGGRVERRRLLRARDRGPRPVHLLNT